MNQTIFFTIYDPADIYFSPAAWSSNYLFHLQFGMELFFFPAGYYLFQHLAATNYLFYHLPALNYLFQKYPPLENEWWPPNDRPIIIQPNTSFNHVNLLILLGSTPSNQNLGSQATATLRTPWSNCYRDATVCQDHGVRSVVTAS